jgi:hypothetical protein
VKSLISLRKRSSKHTAAGQQTNALLYIDFTDCFSPGQCYVALSRARTTAGLQIAGFTDSAVKTHPLALAFHDAPTAGTVDAFLVTVPRWFAPVLGEGSRSELACIVCVRQGVKGWKDVADS